MASIRQSTADILRLIAKAARATAISALTTAHEWARG
jgi:hypothetical protein